MCCGILVECFDQVFSVSWTGLAVRGLKQLLECKRLVSRPCLGWVC